MNPTADMDQAASKIQGHFRRKQARKKKRMNKVKRGTYDRA